MYYYVLCLVRLNLHILPFFFIASHFILEVLSKAFIQQQVMVLKVVHKVGKNNWGQSMLIFKHPKASVLVNERIRVIKIITNSTGQVYLETAEPLDENITEDSVTVVGILNA